MKKILAILLAVVMVVCGALVLTGCGGSGNETTEPVDTSENTEAGTDEALKELVAIEKAVPVVTGKDTDYSKVKIGFIFLHDPSASTYDNNFYQAALAVKEELGLSDDQVMFKWNIPEEGSDCLDTATEFVDAGCNIVFADSFGHESNMKLAAEKFPEVQFCHATGTQGIVAGLANYHNAFANIYEGRYLAGIAAGMKLNEMIEEGKITAEEAKIGYVGAWPYAEVKSGYTSFFLGARSVCKTATMEVVFTNSWFDIALEREGALNLINNGCVLISQHADSEGAPKACEEKGVPNVAYNLNTINLGPTTALISSKINWAPYYKLIIESVATDKAIPADWCGTIETGSVELTELNEKVAAKGTMDAIEAAKADIVAGKIHVFDTAAFTVEGKALETYAADVLDMGDFAPETNVIIDGYFNESVGRSAPYFDVLIDGITLK